MKNKLLMALLIGGLTLSLSAGTPALVSEASAKETDKSTEALSEVRSESESENNAEDQNVPLTLSDDIRSYQIQLNDTIMQFPMWYSDFKALGWTYGGDETETLAPDQYTTSMVFKNEDGLTCYARMANFGQDVLPLTECTVVGFSAEKVYLDKAGDTFTLPAGIIYGESGKDDITAAYGEPDDLYEGSSLISMTYKDGIYNSVKLGLDPETDTLMKVELFKLEAAEGGDQSAAAAPEATSDEVPEAISKYKAPAELGDDLYSFNVEYDGALYTLPAPVAEFEKNGWKVDEKNSDVTVKAQSIGWITMKKAGSELRVMAKNYSDKATGIKNCFVTSVKAASYGPDLTVKLPNGIERGMSEADLQAAVKDVNFETSEEGSYTYYQIYKNTKLDSIVLYVKDGKVDTVEISNSPKYDELFK